jgi:EpsD family peptidyl-prolyl cis-trans isomerase
MQSWMTSAPRSTAAKRFDPARVATITVCALFVALAGCGDAKKDKPASQTAAKVNNEEITVHQINAVLQQQRGLPPEQAASASQQVLERLIDQELAVQKAAEKKLDRDPRVMQQIEAARREIIARAYVEQVGSGAPKPTPEEVKKYYDEKPALFKERRVYSLQELAIEAKPEQIDGLRAKLQSTKDISEFIAFLRSNDYKFSGNQAVRAAEQLPLASLDNFAKMKDGQAIFNATPSGAQVVVLAGSRSQPVDEARARPAIERFLLNERKRKVVEDDLKALRAESKIAYVGEYASGAVKPVDIKDEVKPSKSMLIGDAASAPLVPATVPATMPAYQAAKEPAASVPASAPSANSLEKGLKGLK